MHHLLSRLQLHSQKLGLVKSLNLIVLVVIVAAIPLTVSLLQFQQNIEQQAAAIEGENEFTKEAMATADAVSQSFQPTAPYYATFFYLWYKNATTDGSYSYWSDHNTPPNSWFSHYLPDKNQAVFDPVTELYSSQDYATFQWQAAKLAEAKQEVAIASWWGQGSKEDQALSKILTDFMSRSDNPYSHLRWAIYYEREAINPVTNSEPNNPTVAQLVNDLTYINNQYAQSPYFLKVNNKPVIFVYADSSDNPGTMLQRWAEANAQLGNAFYINLKVFSGFATATPQPDSWHQYAPASRSGVHAPYASFVSPGFWLDDGVAAERLPRDAAAFETAVVNMVAANTTWKITETWNEWGEGTAVEPGEQTTKDSAGKEIIHPAGYPFKNLYVDILHRNLPNLEQGVQGPTPTPTSLPINPTLTPTMTPSPTPMLTPTVTPSTTPVQPLVTPTVIPTPTPVTTSIISVADAPVSSQQPMRNYGTTSVLWVDGISPIEMSFLKFDLTPFAGRNVTRAMLRIYVTGGSMGTQTIKSMHDVSWRERGITYDNRPRTGSIVTTNAGGTKGEYRDIDVTAAIVAKVGGLVTLSFEQGHIDGFDFASKDNNNAAYRPQLVITMQ